MGGQSIKVIRTILMSGGAPFDAAQSFMNRCDSLWGNGWILTNSGVIADGVCVVSREEFAAFASGLPRQNAVAGMPTVKVQVEKPPVLEEVEEELEKLAETVPTASPDPLRCSVCGKRMPSTAALKGHMKKHG